MLVFRVLTLSFDTNVNVNEDLIRGRFYLIIYEFLTVVQATNYTKTNILC